MSYSDSIDSLPLENTPLTPEENEVLNTVLVQKVSAMSKLANSAREYTLLFALFLAFSHPWVDDVIRNVWSVPSSKYPLLFFKALLFVVLYAVLLRAIARKRE